MDLKDSGSRREFDSGAVRDIQTGKGRCDLLPLDVVADIMHDTKLEAVAEFMRDADENHLFFAVRCYAIKNDLTLSDVMLAEAMHYEAGAKKYDERNWEKGIPVHCFIDSGVRHYLKHLRGDDDEPHGTAFVWNMLGAAWTCRHHPDLIDIPGACSA